MINYFTTNLLLNPSISLLHSFLELITTSLHSLISILSHFITTLPHLTSLPLSPPLTLPPFTGYESNEQDRPQFEGEEILSPVDGKRILYFAKADKEYRARIANVSTAFIYFILFLLFFFVLYFFFIYFLISLSFYLDFTHTHTSSLLRYELTHTPDSINLSPLLISSLKFINYTLPHTFTYLFYSYITHIS